MYLKEEYYNRNQLYKEVWEHPVSKVAKDYGVSDVAIAKVCCKLRVPLPGRGYWAKKVYGKEPPTPPLPEYESPPNIARSKNLYQKQENHKEPDYLVPEEHNWVLRQIEFEKDPRNKIKINRNPRTLHPIARSTCDFLRAGGSRLFGASFNDKRICSAKDGLFYVCIGQSNIDRLQIFLSTFLTEMDRRDMKVES